MWYFVYGRCYTIEPPLEVKKLTVKEIQLLLSIDSYVFVHHPKQFLFPTSKSKIPAKVGHSMFLDLTYDLTQDMQKVKHFHNWDHAIYLIKNRISWINYCLPALFLPKASDFAIREPGIVLPARNGCQIWHLSQCRCKERIGRPVWLHSTLHEQPRRKNQIIESMPTTRYEWYRKIEIHHFL